MGRTSYATHFNSLRDLYPQAIAQLPDSPWRYKAGEDNNGLLGIGNVRIDCRIERGCVE